LLRTLSPQIFLFPETRSYILVPSEREIANNCYILKAEFAKIIQKRRDDYKKGGFDDKAGDLLSVLLQDEQYCNDDGLIMDECMTFFFAGSQTTGIVTTNLTLYSMVDQEILTKIRDEL